MHGGGTGKHRLSTETEVLEHHERHEAGAEQQHHRLDDLHPGGGEHAAEGHVEHHQYTDQHHGVEVVDAEQQLDQLAGADHLRHQVHQGHGQGAEGRGQAHRGLFQAIGHHVGKGVFAQVAQAFGNQEQDDRPAGQHAQCVEQAVVAIEEHHRGNAEERGCRDHVAGNRQTVLETGHAATSGIKIAGGAGTQCRPACHAKGEQHEHQEHADGVPVQRSGCAVGGHRNISDSRQRQQEQCKKAVHRAHSCLSFSFSGSITLLAR
ncbi:hypothetical protein D3C73_726380 [compost metagenome]